MLMHSEMQILNWSTTCDLSNKPIILLILRNQKLIVEKYIVGIANFSLNLQAPELF